MRPANRLYGLDDRPPLGVTLLSAIQHVAIIAGIGTVFPLLVLRQSGASTEMIERVMAVSMLALGIATLLQTWRGRRIGSGFLAPAVFTAAYLPGSLAAAAVGGLPLVFGMTIFAGAAEVLMSCALQRLRPYLPTEIAGFTVTLIGIVLGVLGFRLIVGVEGSDPGFPPLDLVTVGVGLFSLVAMIAVEVWGRGTPRLFSGLIGIALGYLAAWVVGRLDIGFVGDGLLQGVTLPGLPDAWPSFSVALIVPFLVGALACTLRAVGDITTCQKINDADWQRPEMRSIRNGVLADGLGSMLAGALGTVGLSTFSGSVGLAAATGVTSRIVGYAAGLCFVALAFVPGIADLLAVMPRPVMGAILIFSSSFIIMNGFRIVMARMLDNRKVLVIGISLVLGLSHYVLPTLYERAPAEIAPALGSALVIGILSAVLLNLVFRIGVKRRQSLVFDPTRDSFDVIYAFVERQGGAWGARRDVMAKVTAAVIELAEAAPWVVAPGGAVTLTLAFDEYVVEVDARYPGRPIPLSGPPPTAAELFDAPDSAALALSALMLRRLAEHIKVKDTEGTRRIRLRFAH